LFPPPSAALEISPPILRSETLAATPKPNPEAPENFRRAPRRESVDFERFAADYAGFAANPCDLSAR